MLRGPTEYAIATQAYLAVFPNIIQTNTVIRQKLYSYISNK